MTFIMFAINLIKHPHHMPEAQVTPEAIIITQDFDVIWVPEGVTGPVVALPIDEKVF